jgi:hypothetical protein
LADSYKLDNIGGSPLPALSLLYCSCFFLIEQPPLTLRCLPPVPAAAVILAAVMAGRRDDLDALRMSQTGPVESVASAYFRRLPRVDAHRGPAMHLFLQCDGAFLSTASGKAHAAET